MDFHLRNRLVVMLEDNPQAFEIASAFVTSEEKLMVFERVFRKQEQGDIVQRAVSATTIAESLWACCYEQPEA
jgi:hypothetical protein